MGSDFYNNNAFGCSWDFNPRSPHGERQGNYCRIKCKAEFQSTLPAWGATDLYLYGDSDLSISIHAPRMGSDVGSSHLHPPVHLYFNPRSPHRERLPTSKKYLKPKRFQSTLPAWGATSVDAPGYFCSPLFQSTLPAWGATHRQPFLLDWRIISIHAPRMGSDYMSAVNAEIVFKFQSTLPAWGATSLSIFTRSALPISIHAPRMGSDKSSRLFS